MLRRVSHWLILLLFVFLSGTGLAQPPSGPLVDPLVPAAVADSVLFRESDVRLVTQDAVFIAIGNSVLRLDSHTGEAVWRTPVSGTVTHLDSSGAGVSVVSALPGGLSERIQVGGGGRPGTTVRFAVDPVAIASLRNEAAVEDPFARLEADPTNAWLYAEAALVTDDADAAGELMAEAVNRAATFYDLAGLARVALDLGHAQVADEAMLRALTDFAERGYDPALLADPAVHELYGFPAQPLRQAIADGDREAAAFWAGWLRPLVGSPGVPHVRSALAAYAASLAASGEDASQWSELTRPAREEVAYSGPDRFFAALGEAGWYMFTAIIIVILALQVTLTLKYWSPQGLAMKRARETGVRAGPLQRFLAIRYFSSTEKLVLLLLFAAGLAVLGLAAWTSGPAVLPSTLGAGTLASAEARDTLETLGLRGERGEFIRGYAAQTAGEHVDAALHYQAAPRFGPAVNNLAVLTDDPSLFEQAQSLAPSLPEIAYNLGDESLRPAFDEAIGLERPALINPGLADFRIAERGTWQQAIGSVFANPLVAARLDSPLAGPQWLWYALFGLYMVLGVLTGLLLLFPRPRMARNAPRSAGYHLMALLVPGAGMADEVWGLLLLVPWALFGVDQVSRLTSVGPLLDVTEATGLIVLGCLYAVNLAAFIVEAISYRRRMRNLFQTSPEAAVAYGRRLPAPQSRPR